MISADLAPLSPRTPTAAELHWPAVGTLIEDPSALPAPRPPLMKRMCCQHLPVPDDAPAGTRPERCDLVLGWVVCAEAMDGLISHGACEACAARWLDELERQPAVYPN